MTFQAPDSGPLDPPGYQLGSLLGTGPAGAVYRGVQLSTGQNVAVKLLSGANPRGRAELDRVLGGLQHPHLVTLLDADLAAPPGFLVMPLMQGSLVTFREQLAPRERVPERLVRVWLQQVGSALDYLHQRGVVHGGIHPRNILLDSEGGARVADVGQAQALGEALGSSVDCMPAEQFAETDGPRVPQVAWDVYALGASFYFLLTGRYPRPFVPCRKLAPHIKVDLARAIDGCLKTNPQERWPSVAAVLQATKPRPAWGTDALYLRWKRASRSQEPTHLLRWLLAMLGGVGLAAVVRLWLPLELACLLVFPLVCLAARPGLTRHVLRELAGPATLLAFLTLTLLSPVQLALARDTGLPRLPVVAFAQALLLGAIFSSPARALPNRRARLIGGLLVLALVIELGRRVL